MYKLVIVDDEPYSCSLLCSLNWASLGIEVVAALDSANKVLEFLNNHTVDIVLTDIQMPGMNGIELTQQLEKLYPDVMVIILSAYDDYVYLRACTKLKNIYDYLLKPIDPDEWLTTFEGLTKSLDSNRIHLDNINPLEPKSFLAKGALEYIKEHYAEAITLISVAEHVHVSHTYLSRVINEELHMGFPDLLNAVRLDHAKKLLNSPQYKINEIANMVGYSSPQYFTRLFKECFGKPPHEYRSH